MATLVILLGGSAVAEPVATPSSLVQWRTPSDAEIRQILVNQIDVQHQGVGIVVGVIDRQGRRIIAYGVLNQGDRRPLNGDTVFEIGSLTKVFTSLLLSEMVQDGELALTDPAQKYLPARIKMPERNGRQIELIDLATHTSGLPGMPSDFYPVKDPANPYAHYTKEQMYRWVSGYRLDRDIGVKFQYSNLGGALLGQIVADRAGVDYETLVHDRITGPLRMRDTAISMTPGMKARLAVGHDDHMRPTSNWDLPAFEGAGGLRSTANDLLTFVGAELGYVDTPLRAAMRAQLRPRRPTANQRQCETLGWAINEAPMPEVIWHDGGTGGYESYMGFDPKTGVGVVVLTNAIGPNGGNDIGFHILMGRPIPSGS